MDTPNNLVSQFAHGEAFLRRTVTPPNRLEISNWEFLANLGCISKVNCIESLRDELRRLTGREHVLFAPSCRAAIAQILSLLPHKEVVMPAFTCAVVKTAVEIAGKQPVFVDISRADLNATSVEYARQAKKGRVLLPTHIFGIPTDIENICEIAKTAGCVTIEDAAAAFGAKRNGRMLGTFADFGVFSFERSKRLPAFRGAAIIVNNPEILDVRKLGPHRLVGTQTSLPIREVARSIAYNLATQPWIYGRAVLPSLLKKRAKESVPAAEHPTDTPFYNRDFHPYQAGLILQQLSRLHSIRNCIAALVDLYETALRDTAMQTFVPAECDRGGLLRFPIAFPEGHRTKILRRALEQGLYLETNFVHPLPKASEHAAFPNAVWAANELILLPLYTRLPVNAARQIVDTLLNVGFQH